MKVLVLGGDGFCGWPSALHLSARGHDVVIVDNLSRRKIDIELEVDSLTPIRPMGERLAAWKDVSGKEIRFKDLTIGKDYQELVDLILEEKPDSIIHFAEQRAAPYSMKSRATSATPSTTTSTPPQRAGRDRGDRARHPPRAPGHHGRLRLRHGGHENPRGLSEGQSGDPRRPEGIRRSCIRPIRARSTT
jgi:saccharopine dehydrogenase-like NADP-dependent oxidoreductase